jgi:GDPmannose 4,6-dehydratase
MWLMMQEDKPEDFVIATGEKYMIKDIITLVFSILNIPIQWSGEGLDEVATIVNSKYREMDGKVVVRIDSKYFRPSEVDILVGDSSKAREKLKWKPEYTFNDIINEMIQVEQNKYK